MPVSAVFAVLVFSLQLGILIPIFLVIVLVPLPQQRTSQKSVRVEIPSSPFLPAYA
jgi:hypothetical protein